MILIGPRYLKYNRAVECVLLVLEETLGRVYEQYKIPATVGSSTWVCSRSIVGTEVSNPTGAVDVCIL